MNWIFTHWRPSLGYSYVAICLFDFLIAPAILLIWSVVQGGPLHIWAPITLSVNAMYHLSMGGILGIQVYGRTKEKLQLSQNNIEK